MQSVRILLLFAGLCGPMASALLAAEKAHPSTAVSVDYCADQYLLALADREQILAVSGDAQQSFSYLADAAAGIQQLHATSEELIAVAPDLVIHSWGWPAGDRRLPEKLGIKFVAVQFGETPAVIAENLRTIGALLGRGDVAERMIGTMQERLAAAQALAAPDPRPTAVYITPSGTTSGSGTLIDQVMQLAGLRNQIAEMGYSGWRNLQLEELVLNPPDVFISSFFELDSHLTDNWNISRHEVMRKFLRDKPVIVVPSKYMACSAWYFLDAVELIQAGMDSAARRQQISLVSPPLADGQP